MSVLLNFLLALIILLSTEEGTCKSTRFKYSRSIARSINDFGLNVFQEISKRKENIVFSPFSAYSALSLAYLGAGSEAEHEMRYVLKAHEGKKKLQTSMQELLANLESNRNVTLENANKIYVGKSCSISEGFQYVARTVFGANSESIDFSRPSQAARSINAWIEKRTKAKIKNVISPGTLPPQTHFLIVNAIYFLGNWLHPFNANQTTEKQFFASEDSEINVPMMISKANGYYYGESNDLRSRVLKLFYKGRGLSLLIILPSETEGVDNVLKTLDVFTLRTINENLSLKNLVVYLPKFKVQKEIKMKSVLKMIGLNSAFDGGDFYSICTEADIIDEMYQKALVEVNEKGTEAAAVTSVVTARKPFLPFLNRPKEFKVNRPFLFIVQDEKSGAILFIGIVRNPKK